MQQESTEHESPHNVKVTFNEEPTESELRMIRMQSIMSACQAATGQNYRWTTILEGADYFTRYVLTDKRDRF